MHEIRGVPWLLQVWHLPIKAAAHHLNVGVSSLKKICRDYKIGRWPYRKLQSLTRLKSQVAAWGGDDTPGLTNVSPCLITDGLAALYPHLSHSSIHMCCICVRQPACVMVRDACLCKLRHGALYVDRIRPQCPR